MSQFDSLDKAFSQLDSNMQSEVEGGNWARRLTSSKSWSGFVNTVNYIGTALEGGRR